MKALNFLSTAAVLLANVQCWFGTSVAQADALDNWHRRYPQPTGDRLTSVAHGNGGFVAVGERGTILTSADGINWTNRPIAVTNTSADVVYGNGRFVAVGYHEFVIDQCSCVGRAPIWTSTNGVDWTPSPTTIPLFGVTYANNLFVAVGSSSGCYGGGGVQAAANGGGGDGACPQADTNQLERILTSSDGLHWTPRYWVEAPLDFGGRWAVAGGTNGFVAVGPYGTILHSTDGFTWVRQEVTASAQLYDVTFGDGLFVAVGGAILTSHDGTNWFEQRQSDVYGITHGNGTFVAVGWAGNILASADGTNWSGSAWAPFQSLYGVGYGCGHFVAVGDFGQVLTSEDNGTNWITRSGGTVDLEGVAYGNGLFVAVGGGLVGGGLAGAEWSGKILVAADDPVWTVRSVATTNVLTGITFADGLFVAIGWPTILTSIDGVNWLPRDAGASASLLSITHGNGMFVAVGTEGTIVTSPDGSTWTDRSLGTSFWLSGIAFGNGTFAAVGLAGGFSELVILTSADGVTWTERHRGSAGSEPSMAYGNGVFVAVVSHYGRRGCAGSEFVTSRDGNTWTVTPVYGCFSAITYGGGLFAALGGNGGLSTSANGADWETHRVGSESEGRAIAFGNGSFVVVGFRESILQSDPIVNLALKLRDSAELTIAGPMGRTYLIECAEHLQTPDTWKSLATVVPTNVPFTWTDPQSTNASTRFYRAAVVP